MGEKRTVDLSPASVRHLTKMINDAADRLARALAGSLAASPAQPDEEKALSSEAEPWMRITDHRDTHLPPGLTVVAFVEAEGGLTTSLVRWVDADRLGEVPAGWRPLLLGPEVKW